MTSDRGTGESDSRHGGDAAAAPDKAFEGPAAFARVLYEALGHAVHARARRLCWCDADFGAWPLGELEWLASLTRWAREPGRELVMIAADYRGIERFHPRFVNWRRDFAHVTSCLLPDETRTASLPTLWVDASGQVLRVFDHEQWRGRAGFDRVDRQQAREEFDAIAQRGAPGFAAGTLGL